MASQENGTKLVWFLTGAAVGAAIALLYAPQSGRQTRKYIREKAEEGCETVTDAGKELLETGRDYYEKSRKLAEEAGDLLKRGKKLVAG
jgi:gas vesicle protein